jgi:starch synthase (maltosyl-transferring)
MEPAAPHSLRHLIARLNRIRREHPRPAAGPHAALSPRHRRRILVYSKTAGDDVVLCVMSCDPFHRRAGFVELDLDALGCLPAARSRSTTSSPTRATSGTARATTSSSTPRRCPGHVFAIRRLVHREQSFDYYL